jgi:hypothetical protein
VAEEVQQVVEGDGFAVANVDALADGPGFRKIRRALGVTHVLGPGGVARVDAATVRRVKNVGHEPAVYLVAGGKDGYVGRDGRLPKEGETSRLGS